MTPQAGIDERIRELVGQHRPELEQLVDQALTRELAQLVEERLARTNGAHNAATAAPATKVCAGPCGRTLPLSSFEAHRAKCRECRRAEARERERAQRRTTATVEQAPAEPERPAAIPVTELLERARPDSRPPAPGLTHWLIAEGLATRVEGGLAPTARTIEIAGALGD